MAAYTAEATVRGVTKYQDRAGARCRLGHWVQGNAVDLQKECCGSESASCLTRCLQAPFKRQPAFGGAAGVLVAGRVACSDGREQVYCSPVCTLVKVPCRIVPMLLTAATITSAIPAAIRLYSIAVAPNSSAKNDDKRRRMVCFPAGLRASLRNCAYAGFATRKRIAGDFR